MTHHEEKKQNDSTNLQNLLTAEFHDEKIRDYIQKYGTNFLIGLASLILLVVAGYAWLGNSRSQSVFDFAEANIAYKSLETAQSGQEHRDSWMSSYLTLKRMMEKHPELEAKYSGLLTQLFLRIGEEELAQKYFQTSIGYLKKQNMPLFEEFAENTMRISKGETQKALDQALALNEKLRSTSEDQQLKEFNLLRLASLQQAMGKPKEALENWSQLKKSTLVNVFETGSVTMDDYINAQASTPR